MMISFINSRTIATLVLLQMIACCGSTRAAALHVDDFQSDTTLGWSGGELTVGVPTLQPTGGPDGDGDAFLNVTANGFSKLATHNSTSLWTGDLNSIGATTVTADLMNALGSDPLDIRFVLFGPNSTANRWTSLASVSVPPDGLWNNYSFSLAEADLVQVAGQASFGDLMEGVVRVMFRHDSAPPSSGGSAVAADLGIDNIRLAGPPSVMGDYNASSLVEQADLDLVLLGWGSESPGTAWVNQLPGTSGFSTAAIDQEELDRVLLNWGSSGALVGQSVPEPITATLLLPVFLMVCRVRRHVG